MKGACKKPPSPAQLNHIQHHAHLILLQNHRTLFQTLKRFPSILAVCAEGCKNDGTCVMPNRCKCKPFRRAGK